MTPIALRAPELIHRESWNVNIDIWTLGCLVCSNSRISALKTSHTNFRDKIFEVATNEPLFPLDSFGLTREEIDKEHETLIDQILSADCQKGQELTGYLTDRLPSDFGAGNVQNLASLLSLMLQRKPQDRLSAESLLRTPFVLGEFQG